MVVIFELCLGKLIRNGNGMGLLCIVFPVAFVVGHYTFPD